MLSQLLTASLDGTRLTDDEIFSHVRLLYAVGATTTSDGLGNLLYALLTQPDVLERVSRDCALRAGVVAETLRWEPPVALLPRYAPFAGRIGGVEIPAGARLLVGIAAANRDPRAFASPDRFDPDRREPGILTFGFGRKFCPGSTMARTQLSIALDALLDRLPGLRLADPEGIEPRGTTLRSPEAIRVEWSHQPRAARARHQTR